MRSGYIGLGQVKSSSNQSLSVTATKGIRVFSLAEEGREADAFCTWHDSKPFVFLNRMKSAERCRFDAAHELGHLVRDVYSMRHGETRGIAMEREAMHSPQFSRGRGKAWLATSLLRSRLNTYSSLSTIGRALLRNWQSLQRIGEVTCPHMNYNARIEYGGESFLYPSANCALNVALLCMRQTRL